MSDGATITADQAATFERCMAVGGVAIFGADTVYGLACDPATRDAVERLYAIKGRRPDKPAAVMFFSLELALAALPELGPRTTAALEGLLPGPVTLLLPNPAQRFPLACGPDPETLGVRVPALGPATAALGAVRWPVMQSSANPSGGADARRLQDIPSPIRDAADLVLDAGELDGTASTVVDLRRFESAGAWDVLREGALARSCVAATLDDLAR
jgi:L-threonylcarbamoyladenylate synthase